MRFLQLVLHESQRKVQILYDTSLSTTFEAQIYFNGTFVVCREAGKKKLTTVKNGLNITLGGMMVSFVQKVCDTITNLCSCELMQAIVEPYVLLYAAVIQFQVALLRPDVVVSLKQQ